MPSGLWTGISESFKVSWYRLEYMLFHVCKILEVSCSSRSEMGRCTRPWKPSFYFNSTAPDAEAKNVRNKIWAGRDQFFVVLAYISYLIAHLDHEEERKTGNGRTITSPAWHHSLRNSGIHPDIIDLLTEVGVADWSRERMGCVVDLKTSAYPDKLEMMVKRGVPVIYYWPSWNAVYLIREPLPSQYIQRFFVRNQEDEMVLKQWLNSFEVPSNIKRSAEAARARSKSLSELPERDKSTLYNGPSFPSGDYPVLDWRSGQEMYETRNEFILRRAEERNLQLERESSKMRKDRLSKEDTAKLAKVPEANGKTSVYLWSKEGDGGWEVRRKLDPSLVASVWYTYSTHEKSYDSVKDEWDLWRLEGDHVSLEECMDNWEDHMEVELDSSSTDATTEPEEVPVTKEINMVGDWDDLKGHTEVDFDETFVDVAKAQLGYKLYEDDREYNPPEEEWSDNKCMRILLLPNSEVPVVEMQRIKHLTQFLSVASASASTSNVPSALWDLRCANVQDFGNNKIQIKGGWHSKEFAESYKGGKPVYEILHKEGLKDVRLFVTRANAAVEIKRVVNEAEIAKQDDIPLYLLFRGIPFILARDWSENVNVQKAARHEIAPQTRIQEYIPDKTDYMRYLKRRHEFLRSEKGAKVLRMGGILWRLALESITPDEGARPPGTSVTGLMHEIYNDGNCSIDAVDQALTLDELGLVYGLYHTYSGKRSKNGVNAALTKLQKPHLRLYIVPGGQALCRGRTVVWIPEDGPYSVKIGTGKEGICLRTGNSRMQSYIQWTNGRGKFVSPARIRIK